MNRYAFLALLALVLLLPACGGGGSDSPPAACTNTANMELYTSAATTMLMTSITVSASQNTVVPAVPIYAAYQNPPVAAILGGYPYGGVNPGTYGIHLVAAGTPGDNPFQFDVNFDTTGTKGTYNAVLRFVATDATPKPVDCQDVQVTFTVN
jgi:hypothetical protein